MTDHERLRLLSDGYASALQRYLVQPDESALASAYELGRKALGDGKGVLEMATVHSYALVTALNQARTDADRAMMLEALEKFQNEVLSPFEMAQRGFRANSGSGGGGDARDEQVISRVVRVTHPRLIQALLSRLKTPLVDVEQDEPAHRGKRLRIQLKRSAVRRSCGRRAAAGGVQFPELNKYVGRRGIACL